MTEEVRKIIESGILEEYLLGFANANQVEQVKGYLEKYPAVKAHYQNMEAEVENYASKYAIPAPKGTKDSILQSISSNDNLAPLKASKSSSFNGFSVAAGILALLACSFAFLQNNKLKKLTKENGSLSDKYEQLKEDCQNQNVQYAQLNQIQEILKHPATHRVLLFGNDRAPRLESVAFWNNVAKKAHLNISGLPALPKDHCLQIWADINGQMIDLGVIPNEVKVINLPYKLNAESLNITIEPVGGSEHPTVSRLVSSQTISI